MYNGLIDCIKAVVVAHGLLPTIILQAGIYNAGSWCNIGQKKPRSKN